MSKRILFFVLFWAALLVGIMRRLKFLPQATFRHKLQRKKQIPNSNECHTPALSAGSAG